MRKFRLFGYMALVVTPIAISCSVGTDNTVTYYISGHLRNEAKKDLTNNYWNNLDSNNASQIKKDVLESLLKESGVGINLTHMSISSIWQGNTKVAEPSTGTGVGRTDSVLYNCQIELPADLSDEDKKKVATPNPKECNENDEELKKYLNSEYRTHLNIVYTGSTKYATSKIKSKEEVFFCAITNYDNTSGSIKATIEELQDGKCE